jgi:pyruvate, water dikinase
VDFIHWLSQIENSEKSLVGDEIFLLSQLLNYGHPILPGLAIDRLCLSELLSNSQEYKTLIHNTPDYWLQLNINDDRSLQATARQCRQIIEKLVLSSEWETKLFNAVSKFNSSAVILEPYFLTETGEKSIPGELGRAKVAWLDSGAISLSIKHIWSRLFTAQSIFYWHKLGKNIDRVNCAILIQPLSIAIASGTITIATETIIIEATRGLAFSLWQGEVNPDKYIIDRHNNSIINQQQGFQERAYRLGDNPNNPLECYLIDEADSESWVLTAEDVAILIKITHNLQAERANLITFSWNLRQDDGQFYITHLEESSKVTIEGNKNRSQPILTGLAAAPGQTFAEVIINPNFNLPSSAIPAGSILVTKSVPPDKIFVLKQLGGIITEIGGLTSHGAIAAREFGIPAIVNAVNATKILQPKTQIFLDGSSGKVYRENIGIPKTKTINHPANLSDTIATKLMVNLSQIDRLDYVASLPVDGIGLLRSEILLGELLASESIERWRQEKYKLKFIATASNLLRQFAAAFAPRPIFYRSFDIGDRGTYNYLSDPTLFDLELTVLAELAQEGYNNINLILPYVRSVREFDFCLRRITKFGLTDNPTFQLWVMAEVPSVIFLLPEYIQAGVQGIAIGSNDLTQLLLGFDRENVIINDLNLTVDNSALDKAIAQLIQTAKDYNIPRSICGQAPLQNPKLIDNLIKWGINTISVEPDAIVDTYKAIARAEKRLLLDSIYLDR